MAATASTSASSLACQSADAMSPMPSILLRKGRKVLHTNRFTRSWRREQTARGVGREGRQNLRNPCGGSILRGVAVVLSWLRRQANKAPRGKGQQRKQEGYGLPA